METGLKARTLVHVIYKDNVPSQEAVYQLMKYTPLSEGCYHLWTKHSSIPQLGL